MPARSTKPASAGPSFASHHDPISKATAKKANENTKLFSPWENFVKENMNASIKG